MAQTTQSQLSVGRLILVPAVITLAITILRLAGEFQHWNVLLFNPAPGGGAALVGISWLPLIFGIYFALKLSKMGEAPERMGPTVWRAIVGIALIIAGAAAAASAFGPASPNVILTANLAAAIAVVIQASGWPAL